MSVPTVIAYRRVVRVLVALGGNAMTSPDGRARPEDQIAAISAAMEPIAELIASGHDVVLTHGNGPQVGNLLVKNELSAAVVPPVPLDWCGASTQATIGFTVLNALEPALARHGVRRPVAALVCRTLVDADDPGFRHPTKPVGRYLPRDEAQTLIDHGQIWEDRGDKGWRRVVASPEPREIIDAEAVHALVTAGFVVVTSGGGGIPCVREADGTVRGVEAVIDKDLSAALLGRALDADALVIATDVDHVVLGWGTPDARPLTHETPQRMRELAGEGHFASGSMGPKVEAATRFVENGGRRAVICSLRDIAAAVEGGAGTVIESVPATA
jgi:carbamate kinase